MIIVNIVNLDKIKYKKLIYHILDCCDEISFQLPGLSHDGMILPDEEWQEYHEKNKTFLQMCYQYGAKQSCSKHYNGMKLGLYGKIIHVKPFPALKDMLLKHHLFDWLVENDLPEDVCFFSKNKLRFFTCSHDEEFIVYDENDKDIFLLKTHAFEFWEK